MSPKASQIFASFFKELEPLHKAYKDAGYDLRFVGGCVRDALLGKAGNDIDLATPLPPEEGLALLKKSKIECIPTGIKYGTITAIIHKKPYEITTLRQDVTTDGRWPVVSYSTDWIEDAKRRDLTINALYLDFNGHIYDYFNGIQDLETGIIRFIGNAEDRINEDYLRLLRIFRFYARYAKVPLDNETMGICAKLAPKLTTLSSERITKELLRLLEAPAPEPSLILMEKSNILATLFRSYALSPLRTLFKIEKELPFSLNPILRLSLLTKDYTYLRLSNADLKWIHKIHTLNQEDLFHEPIYRYHLSLEKRENVIVAAVIKSILDTIPFDQLKNTISIYENLVIPPFPINGDDLISFKLSGPSIGELLRKCRIWWAEEKFNPTKNDCLLWIQKQKA